MKTATVCIVDACFRTSRQPIIFKFSDPPTEEELEVVTRLLEIQEGHPVHIHDIKRREDRPYQADVVYSIETEY